MDLQEDSRDYKNDSFFAVVQVFSFSLNYKTEFRVEIVSGTWDCS